MDNGYRLFAASVSACIAMSLLIGWFLQPKPQYLADDSGYRGQASSYRAGGPSCSPAQIGSLPVRLRQRRADACAEKEEGHREATDSVIEARRSAIAANAQANFIRDQTGIAAWAFGAGITTLIAATAAAVFAERAAYHTKRSADLAENAERGRLIFKHASNSFEQDKPGLWLVAIAFANVGRTYAIVETATYDGWSLNLDYQTFPEKFPRTDRLNRAIAPGDDIVIASVRLQRGGKGNIAGYIDYIDVVGKPHRTHFNYACNTEPEPNFTAGKIPADY
ncbi:hypothetical protein [Novosphingobium sp.]|uniref:hypothetical protein n=1 Tax=Novosphingobium sp. TaxID=1874826 RepID=UPI003D148F65